MPRHRPSVCECPLVKKTDILLPTGAFPTWGPRDPAADLWELCFCSFETSVELERVPV